MNMIYPDPMDLTHAEALHSRAEALHSQVAEILAALLEEGCEDPRLEQLERRLSEQRQELEELKLSA